jgi:opacity protein-like surface antigen
MRVAPALGVVLLLSFHAAAQETPRLDLFGGYSFSNTPLITGARGNLNGWNVSVAANINRWFSVATEFGGHYGSSTRTLPPLLVPIPCPPNCFPNRISTNEKVHTILFGPQFALRTEKLTPFVHLLAGVSRLDGKITYSYTNPPLTSSFIPSDTSFAVAAGGGLDYEVSRNFAWRVPADYLETAFSGRALNNFRLSTGIVFHFGR